MKPLLIGIDVGWSGRRKSCALAISGPVRLTGGRYFGSDISVGVYRLPDLISELTQLIRKEPDCFRSAVLVIDGPVGPELAAIPKRRIDSACSKGGFCNRAPSYPITHGSGLELSKVTLKILAKINELLPVHAWLGGDVPTNKIVVAETNPTLAMALLVPPQDIAQIPSRRRHRLIGTRRVRAKSDWYWHLGGASYAASVLNDERIANETHHERVAAFFSLTLAKLLAQQNVVAIGDKDGTYVVPPTIDYGWRDDIFRVGITHGRPHFENAAPRDVQPTKNTVSNLLFDDFSEKAFATSNFADERPVSLAMTRHVQVVLNDNGGLNAAANPWLLELEFPCLVSSAGAVQFEVTGFFSGRRDMCKITPSALTVARRFGFGGNHLSRSRQIVLTAAIDRMV